MPENMMCKNHKWNSKEYTDRWEMTFGKKHITDHRRVRCPHCGCWVYNPQIGKTKICPQCGVLVELVTNDNVEDI